MSDDFRRRFDDAIDAYASIRQDVVPRTPSDDAAPWPAAGSEVTVSFPGDVMLDVDGIPSGVGPEIVARGTVYEDGTIAAWVVPDDGEHDGC